MAAKKVLIVDDDSLLSKTIDMCLSKRGHDVKVFYSGVDAVKYLFEEKPDSIVLDIRLPDCDGWFIAKFLEKLEWFEKVPFIVISVLEPDRRQIAELKPYAYIQKPFDMGQLLQTVENSLSKEQPRVDA
ncbi:MAG: response regulator [Dehalococcoidia bacterium]